MYTCTYTYLLMYYTFQLCFVQYCYSIININISAILLFTVTLYFKVSLLQCNYTFKYWVILINYTYLLYG